MAGSIMSRNVQITACSLSGYAYRVVSLLSSGLQVTPPESSYKRCGYTVVHVSFHGTVARVASTKPSPVTKSPSISYEQSLCTGVDNLPRILCLGQQPQSAVFYAAHCLKLH